MSEPSHVGVARFLYKPEWAVEIATHLIDGIPSVVANPDNYQFEYYRYESDRLRFLLYQTFASDAAFEAHRTLPARLAGVQASLPKMEHPPVRSFWRPSDGERPSRPNGVVEAATMIVLHAKKGERDRLVEQIRSVFKPGRRLIHIDISNESTDSDRVMVFARWSGLPNLNYNAISGLSSLLIGVPEILPLVNPVSKPSV